MSSLDTRRFTIGGSDCGAAAGIHPYLSAIGLWTQKTGRADQPESDAMEWGVRLEQPIREALRDRGYELAEIVGTPLVDQTSDWVTGSPDGIVKVQGEPAVLEIKTTSSWAHRAGWESDVPPHYAAQAQWYMHLTGLPRCLFAVLVGGQKLEVRTVERSDHAIRLLLRECAKFHSCLVTDTPPRPDGSKSSRDALSAMFPQARPETVIRLTRSQMKDVDRLRVLKAQAQVIDAQVAEIENNLRAAMGDNHKAISPSDEEVIRWSNTTSRRVDTKRLKQDRPEIAQEYETETNTRRFTVL